MILETFKAFMADEAGWEMYVSGPAGSGKTTGLKEIVQYCREEGLSYIVCAYTHKACNVIRGVLDKNANVATLHSFLVKRPGINDLATKVQHISISKKVGDSDHYDVMILDEYSMLGEKDYADIGLIQDPNYEGKPKTKVVYLGDPNQLPPVNDVVAVYPTGKYNVKLTKIYRQAGDNPLKDTLAQLVSFIAGEEPTALKTSTNFIRGKDIISEYSNDETSDKVILAYTNEAVERLNREISCRHLPNYFDKVFSPSTRQFYEYIRTIPVEGVTHISRAYKDDELTFGSKYKTLEHLISMPDILYMHLTDEDSYDFVYAVVFGHYRYKKYLEDLGAKAVKSNTDIEAISNGVKAKDWAYNNNHHKLARARAKAWRDYITFKECVICVDFPYAMTVHKSQGSTFDTVYLDSQDLNICADKDYKTYLKLMYVALSRASNKVVTN